MKLWHIIGAVILAIAVNVAAMYVYDRLTKK